MPLWLNKKFFAAASLAALSLCLSGCIYLRLLELKHQLADFDRNFQIQSADGVEFTCLHPVLLVDDMSFFGITPERRMKEGPTETWDLRWVKVLPIGASEPPGFAITARTHFREGKLDQFALSESFFGLVPKALLIDTLRALGKASVETSSKSASTHYTTRAAASDTFFPNLSRVREMLGRPYSEQTINTLTEYEYRYVTVPQQHANDAIRIRLRFITATGKLKSAMCAFTGGKINLNME
ncbi:MAG TPA: hypothetical protein VKC60_07260 [Opitutaceae bacterium]|nr:hypothetical protein [Opitutaceae bacterium]